MRLQCQPVIRTVNPLQSVKALKLMQLGNLGIRAVIRPGRLPRS